MTCRLRHCLLLALLVLLMACTPTETVPTPTVSPPPTATPTPLPQPTATVGGVPQTSGRSEAQGTLRFVQAAPESGSVDIYLEQALVGNQLSLGGFTNPLRIAAGEYTLQVVPAGALPDTDVLATTRISVAPESIQTVLVTGTADTLVISVYEEDQTPIPAGQSRLVFLNGVPRGPQVTPQIDGREVAQTLDFGQISDGVVVSALRHDVALSDSMNVLSSLNLSLTAQRQYTVLLLGQTGGEDLRLVVFDTFIEAPGQLRFIHAAPDLPAVDVYLDETPVAAGLTYRTASEWTTNAPQPYTLRVLNSADGETITSTNLTLNAGQTSSILLYEERGLPAVQVVPARLTATPPLTAYLIVINAAPDAPTLVGQTEDELLTEIAPVRYGSSSTLVEFRAGTINLLWVTGQGDAQRAIENNPGFTFEAGVVYTYIVTGDDEDEPFLLTDETGVDESMVSDFALADGATTLNAVEQTNIRVINALADGRSVSLQLDDTPLLENLPARTSSAVQAVPTNRYTLSISAADLANEPTLYTGSVSLLEQSGYVLLLYGTANEAQVSVLAEYEGSNNLGQVVLRALHAAPDAGQLTITLDIRGIAPTPGAPTPEPTGTVLPASPTPQVNRPFNHYESSRFGPGDSTEFVRLPTDRYEVSVTNTTDGTVAAIISGLNLQEEGRYELLLLPGAAPGTFDAELLVNLP